jgi:hypothetical protein
VNLLFSTRLGGLSYASRITLPSSSVPDSGTSTH